MQKWEALSETAGAPEAPIIDCRWQEGSKLTSMCRRLAEHIFSILGKGNQVFVSSPSTGREVSAVVRNLQLTYHDPALILLTEDDTGLEPAAGNHHLLDLPPVMSLVNLAHVCSHLQNASKARLGLTSIPSSNLHFSLCLNLHKQGFLSTVIRGGPSPPDLTTLHTGEPLPSAPDATAYLRQAHQGSNDADSHLDKLVEEATVTQENVATRRLWLGLKYWNSQPVLSEMKMVSKPKQRIWLNSQDIGTIVRGREAGYVKGLTRPGECLFVTTDKGIMEARECVERRIGGMILCRVN